MTYEQIGQLEQALRLKRDVYSGALKTWGEEDFRTIQAAINYADSLRDLKRFKEAKALLRNTMPVARRSLREGHHRLTLKMRSLYAAALYQDPAATLDDLREAVTTLEDTERTARRVFGGANPVTGIIEGHLRLARVALAARET